MLNNILDRYLSILFRIGNSSILQLGTSIVFPRQQLRCHFISPHVLNKSSREIYVEEYELVSPTLRFQELKERLPIREFCLFVASRSIDGSILL